jgi:hypothetical protein
VASLRAAFEGPYSLTPPSPGVYQDWTSPTNYGGWLAFGAQRAVNTSNAPTRLILEVPAHSFFANSLTFATYAIADGVVSFDCTTTSTAPGYFSWLRQSPGTNRPAWVDLNGGPAGEPRHFDFEVRNGDLFGFQLLSGSDAIGPGDPEAHALTVENFVGPIPLPRLTMPSATALQWEGVSNVTYSVQSKTNLAGTNWIVLGTAHSATTNFTFTNLGAAPQQFFRLAYP